MPMSLKCMIDKWLHKGQISQEEYDAVMKKLEGHDKQIRNKAIDDFFLKAVKAYYDDNLNECELCNIEKQLKGAEE